MEFRDFNISSVGIGRTELDEFKIGSHIMFDDPYKQRKGTGVIESFAQADNYPIIWYRDDKDGQLYSEYLGWCKLID